jgi:hypothetical protein
MNTVAQTPRVIRRETQPNRDIPDRVFMSVPGIPADHCALLGETAVTYARQIMPRMSGNSARNLRSFYGDGYFGIRWTDNHVWFQEAGIRPFTMRTLEGKTIPMWVNDPTGAEARKNPKAETRVTDDGRRQTLIFRKVAKHGQRRTRRGEDGNIIDAGPASYPGAPGRISVRTLPRAWQTPGRVISPGGRIAPGNVGVRWRHPGLPHAHFLYDAMMTVAAHSGLENPVPLYSTSQRWRGMAAA